MQRYSVGTLALLASLVVAGTGFGDLAFAARRLLSRLEEYASQSMDSFVSILLAINHLAIFQDTHNDGTTSVSSGMLGEVVTAGELLAALVALEWLILTMEGAVVTLEVFLTSEAAVAKLADKGLGWILGQRLFSATAVDGGASSGSGTTSIRTSAHCLRVSLGRA